MSPPTIAHTMAKSDRTGFKIKVQTQVIIATHLPESGQAPFCKAPSTRRDNMR